MRFWFLKKTPPKTMFSSCFSLNSALKTIDAQIFFLLVFLKTHKKVIDRQKRHFGRFWWLITFFCAFSKILIKITIACLLCSKLKLGKIKKKKMVDPQKRAFLSFEIKKTVNKIFFIFFVCSSFNNKRLTNVMLISIF